MADVVNLNRARKAKARAERAAQAQSNRAWHGRSKADRHAAEVETGKADRFLEAHRLADRPGPDEPR